MSEAKPDELGGHVDVHGLPIDPDVDPEEEARNHPVDPFAGARRSRWPRLRPDVVVAVFVGGCAGGLVRYVVTETWPTPDRRFPWATFAVNVAGTFLLALALVFTAEIRPSRYLRPLVGTGFCGALTTFSAVVVTTVRLFGDGRWQTAVAYLLASIVAALSAAWSGLVVGRAVAVNRDRAHRGRSTP